MNKASRRARTTENAFVSALIEDRMIIEPLIPAFQQIRFSTETFQSILNAANVDALETAASDIAKRNFPLVRELFAASGRPFDFREFVTKILGTYARWFYVEGDDSGTQSSMVLRHSFGLKWSIFVKSYIRYNLER